MASPEHMSGSVPGQSPNSVEGELVDRSYVEQFLREKKDAEISSEDVEQTIHVIQTLHGKFADAVQQRGQAYDRQNIARYLLKTLDEAHGNFNNIFEDQKISWQEFMGGLSKTPDAIEMKYVDPLEYYHNVGNGMDAAKTRVSILETVKKLKESNAAVSEDYTSGDSTRITNAARTIVESELFYAFLDKKTIERAKKENGYDHVASTMRQLSSLAGGKELTPAFVAKFSGAPPQFEGKPKVILDGTHRALTSAIARNKQHIFEVNMDTVLSIGKNHK